MAEKKWQITQKDGYSLVLNDSGAALGGQKFIFKDGFAFKDLNGNGIVEPYEDWRLPLEERVRDLASRMSIEQIAGLMLYSSHQMITKSNPFTGIYQGEGADTRENIWDLTAEQKRFLGDDNVRHVLMALTDSAVGAARWNNRMQAFAEGIGLGIPVNISSDPRHTPQSSAEFDIGAGGDISLWPEPIGLAASFDPALVKQFGEIASKEYRAMGIATALSPQIDLATEPRWNRFSGTFGIDARLTTDMARAYCEGFQTSEGAAFARWLGAAGWGFDSVNVMAKHWPGGGTGEGGRDAHYGYGKFAVYPNGNFAEHLKPFIGVFSLEGAVKSATAVMPYYTVSWGVDKKNGENVGNSFSKYLISDLLRGKYGYDGVVCTDWLITHDAGAIDKFFFGKCWGVEKLRVAQRHYKAIKAGVDQFGGNNEAAPLLEAYRIGCAEIGREKMRERFEASAKRLLRNIFRAGLFENPYCDPEETGRIAGNAQFKKAGYEAQVKSVILLKNKTQESGRPLLPLAKNAKVYIPIRRLSAGHDWFGRPTPARELFPLKKALAEEHFTLETQAQDADVAICFIESPHCLPYIESKGYLPITLQYRPYTAEKAREISLAAESNENRSYRGKTNTAENENDLDMILETKKLMGDKPVVVIALTKNPFVVSEFESCADALLLSFGVESQAVLDILDGSQEPSALLPFQMPADMETIETHAEDTAHDLNCYTDQCGNVYDFAFGMNWNGVIDDWRTKKYKTQEKQRS